MENGWEEVDPREVIYRRIFAGEDSGNYNPSADPPIGSGGFNPTPEDTDGISVTRARYGATPADVGALGTLGKKYVVVGLLAGDLEAKGMKVKPDPDLATGNIGHAIIPAINYIDHKNKATKKKIAELKQEAKGLPRVSLDGPFLGTVPPPPLVEE
jgi:hypothetical protein